MSDVQIDPVALQRELGLLLREHGREALRPAAEALTAEARQIATRNFRHPGEGVRSIHHEYFSPHEYRVSYDGAQHSYMGLWEIGTREFPPRPYLRPAVAAVQHR